MTKCNHLYQYVRELQPVEGVLDPSAGGRDDDGGWDFFRLLLYLIFVSERRPSKTSGWHLFMYRSLVAGSSLGRLDRHRLGV